MSLELPNSVKILSDEPLDAKYLNGKVSYASLEEANTLIPIGIRSPYLTIVVQGAEYWWADGAWQLKTPHITKTLTEINTLIASNGLVKGSLYKITGCQTALYGGTDLYLRALETNKLDTKGVGKFFTPKYENISGNGIWKGFVECGVSTIVGLFDVNELITANNGATGQLFGNVNGGFITPLTGNFTGATSITGNASGATALINTVSVPLTYSIGAKTIWGGYHWTNLTGNLGSKIDDYTLDATNWVKVAFNETDYNFSFDEVDYDILNDWISYRKGKLGNEVSFTYVNYLYFLDVFGISYNAIKNYKWNNYNNTFNGFYSNNIYNGYWDSLNFRGLRVLNSFFKQGSLFSANTIGLGSIFSSNSLEQASQFSFNTIGKNFNCFQNNLMPNSKHNYNVYGINSFFNQNTLMSASEFNYNSFANTSGFYGNTLKQFAKFTNNIIPTNKSIKKTTFEEGVIVNGIDFTTATDIFLDYSKTVYSTPNGTLKLRYYNNNNVLVIADITD